MTLLAIDIGGTAVKYGIWEQESLRDINSFKTPSTWEEMKSSLRSLFDSLEGIEGVAISAPGAVDSERGIIGGISAVPYVHHFPIVEELKELFGVPVSIENDANCAALAEIHFGSAKDVNSAAFFIIGSGIGGALSFNHQLVKGPNLFGGEFGYLLIEGEKTLSTLGSPVVVARDYAAEHGLPEDFSGKDLFALADGGDTTAQAAVDSLYGALAKGIYTLCVTVNPEMVVIGGGLSSRAQILEPIQLKVRELLEETGASDVEVDITFCQYRQDANLIGAVANFLK